MEMVILIPKCSDWLQNLKFGIEINGTIDGSNNRGGKNLEPKLAEDASLNLWLRCMVI